jgi:hypothetical protein
MSYEWFEFNVFMFLVGLDPDGSRRLATNARPVGVYDNASSPDKALVFCICEIRSRKRFDHRQYDI